jgi:hypothetical protein
VGVAGWLDRHFCVNNIVTIAIFTVLLYWHRNLDGYHIVRSTQHMEAKETEARYKTLTGISKCVAEQ